jgi:signal transduction histidine kinase
MKSSSIGFRLTFSLSIIMLLMLLGSTIGLWQIDTMRVQAQKINQADERVTSLLRVYSDVVDLAGEQTLNQYILDLLHQIDVETRVEQTQAINNMQRAQQRAFFILLATALLIMAAGIILGIVIMRSIAEPLKCLNEGAKAFARGDFRPIAVSGDDEFANLSRLFNNAVFSVKEAHDNLEQKVHERTQQMEVAIKELEAFSYSVSHDLRAPLRSIDGFSQILLEEHNAQLDAQGQDYLRRVRLASQRMEQLINDMIKLSRVTRTEINIEKVNLTRIAWSVINELQESNPQRHVDVRIADDLEDNADSRLMHIMLENLLGNAWKFTQKQSAAVIEFGCTKEGKKKIYFVRDNGAGFDMTYMDKLFTPFQRLHTAEDYPGTGIGLATVRRIIHRHEGNIWAEGQVGKGATFYFTLHE